MIEAVYHILSNNSALTNLVSTRIYPLRLPIDTDYPAITYQLISDVPVNTKTGRAKYFNARIQINCFAKDGSTSGIKSAQTIERAVRAALERVSPAVYGGIIVINTTFLGSSMSVDDSSDYDGVFYYVSEFNICHGTTS